MFSEKTRIERLAALQIVVIYALFAALWIYFSDRALGLLTKNIADIVYVSILKGFLFIIVTGALLYLLISRHIKKSRKAEEALQEADRFKQQIIDSAEEGVVVYSPDLRYQVWNPFMEKLCGVPARDVLGRKAFEVFPFLKETGVIEKIELALSGQAPSTTEVPYFIPHTGRSGWITDTNAPLRNTKGDVIGVIGTVRDITERKKAEEEKEKLKTQLLQAQKMEAVGQLAGGIAHDFNNILTAIIGYGHILKIKMHEDDPLKSYPNHILALSEKAANLTQSLLAFSRKQIINPRPVNLNEIIKHMEKLLSRIIGEDLRLETVLSEKDLIVMADSGQMEQVFMNFATNARDAMPGGGLLRIGTEALETDEEFIREHGFGKAGKYALISITDTGTGMDKETGEKIFEPFFTTKDVGKGTGLGLAMVYGIITQHEGHINFQSEPGKGTTFRIYLPLTQAKREAEELKPPDINPPETGTETILLAEDEADVRVLTKKLLEDYGYRVIDAFDGADALHKFKLHKDQIEMVILDVIMPNKNGREVYGEIKEMKPDVKALFTTGYPADIVQRQGIPEEGFDLIMKPVAPAALLKKIREVLDK